MAGKGSIRDLRKWLRMYTQYTEKVAELPITNEQRDKMHEHRDLLYAMLDAWHLDHDGKPKKGTRYSEQNRMS